MAFKFALLAAFCIAQGFAFQPLDAFRQKNACLSPAFVVPYKFEMALNEMDQVRESVSMAAMEAYAKGDDIEVIVACFNAQRENFMNLGKHVFEMIQSASQELAEDLGDKAEKYAKLIEVPMRNIADTMRALPEKVYNFIKNKEFNKALEAMREARKVVEENTRTLREVMEDMAAEVPEIADKLEKKAEDISKEIRKGCNKINEAIRKCVEEGGPK